MSSSDNSLFCINNNGNVGIGNNPTLGTPAARLYIKAIDSTSSNYALKVDNLSSTNGLLFNVRNDGNVGFNGTSFGGGVGVLFKGFAATVPTTNPTGGVIDYVENTGSGVQKYRDRKSVV